MSGRNRDGGADGLLIFSMVLMGIIMFGPVLALGLRDSLTQIGEILLPIAGSVVLVIMSIIVIRNYWSRW